MALPGTTSWMPAVHVSCSWLLCPWDAGWHMTACNSSSRVSGVQEQVLSTRPDTVTRHTNLFCVQVSVKTFILVLTSLRQEIEPLRNKLYDMLVVKDGGELDISFFPNAKVWSQSLFNCSPHQRVATETWSGHYPPSGTPYRSRLAVECTWQPQSSHHFLGINWFFVQIF